MGDIGRTRRIIEVPELEPRTVPAPEPKEEPVPASEPDPVEPEKVPVPA